VAFSLLRPFPVSARVRARIERLEIPWNRYGLDPYGVDREELAHFFSVLEFFYERYFRVTTAGLRHVPARGRAMLVGNHSGGWALDALMVLASVFFDLEPPRLAQGMVEKFLERLPFTAQATSRLGQFPGLPDNARRLLEDERLLMVFPEGARGTAKRFFERDTLVRFGTGFVRLALETKTPIVPFAFVGGGEAIPTILNLDRLGKRFGLPYVPITPYLLPIPLPVHVVLVYGPPMTFDGTGRESDETVRAFVAQVKTRIADLLRKGRAVRKGRLSVSALEAPR